MDLGLFAVSAAVLALEILQFKIFAFSLDPLTIYLAVGVCLLGLGVSATVLALAPDAAKKRAPLLSGAFAVVGAAAVPLAHVVFARMAGTLFDRGLGAAFTLIALTVPYFCFGMTITSVFVYRGTMIGRAYAANLAGSGLGCLIVFPLLDALGAERAIVIVAVLALVGGFVLWRDRGGGAWVALVVTALGLAGSYTRANDLFAFPPDPSGQLSTVLDRAAALKARFPRGKITATGLFSRWDRTARVDVYRLDSPMKRLQSRIGDPLEVLFFVQDASAGSILLGVRDDLSRARAFFERTVYGAGYARGHVADVLIIGLGGAPDVQTALYHGAERIVGVEINRSTIELVRGEFGPFLGDPYGRPEVVLHQMDGRTYLRSASESYDLIQMSGADTKSIFASGSLSVNENYLYTREAMVDLLDRLKPDGLLVINRFGDLDSNRLASIAVAALEQLGAPNPKGHLFIIGQGKWRCVVVKRVPLTSAEVKRLHEWVDADPTPPRVVIPMYDWIGVSLGAPLEVLYSPQPMPVSSNPFLEALARDGLEEYIARSPFDYSAPVDDRPFFFLRFRPADVVRKPPRFLQVLYSVLMQLFIVAAVSILVPLVVLRWRGLRTSGSGRSLVYFASLGAAFMLIEIGLINRFVLLLGHQSYSITVVLFGLLLGASLGSFASGRLSVGSRGPLTAALVVLVLLVLGASLVLGPFFHSMAGEPFGARLTLAFLVLTTLGVPLGIPFPTALRALSTSNPPLVPWGVGINAFASVVASTIAVPLAMLVGLRALLVAGAALYGLAILTAPVAMKAGDESS